MQHIFYGGTPLRESRGTGSLCRDRPCGTFFSHFAWAANDRSFTWGLITPREQQFFQKERSGRHSEMLL